MELIYCTQIQTSTPWTFVPTAKNVTLFITYCNLSHLILNKYILGSQILWMGSESLFFAWIIEIAAINVLFPAHGPFMPGC